MTNSDIGLQLLSLYRDTTRARHNNDSDKDSNASFKYPDTSTVEGMTTAILSSLDNRDFDNALTLLNEWVMNYPLEKEGTCLYNYLRAEYHSRLLDGEENMTEFADNLNAAIDAANTFFIANSEERHAMDDVAEELYNRIKRIIESIRQDDLKETGLEILDLDEPQLYRYNPMQHLKC